MVSNYAVTVSNVVCIDLLHSSWEEIQNYILISNASKGVTMYLKHYHTVLHHDLSDEVYPHLVYIEDNFIIGTKRIEGDYSSFDLGGFEILTENKKAKPINKTFFDIVELFLVEVNSLEIPSFLLDCFQLAFKKSIESNRYEATFLNAHIQVSDSLAIPLSQLKEQYNVAIHFLENPETIDTSNLILKEIYYRDQFPLIFVFKDDENNNFMAWNEEYLVALQNIKCNKEVSIDKSGTVDKILDKINKVGFVNLEEEEINFLNFYSKSL